MASSVYEIVRFPGFLQTFGTTVSWPVGTTKRTSNPELLKFVDPSGDLDMIPEILGAFGAGIASGFFNCVERV